MHASVGGTFPMVPLLHGSESRQIFFSMSHCVECHPLATADQELPPLFTMVPLGELTHFVPAVSFWTVPGSHCRHAVAPSMSENVPL